MNLSDSIQTLLIYALPVLFAITLHEAAHGYVAHLLGDDTAWVMGRVTLNPLAHIDLVGTILLPIVMYLSTAMTPMGPLLFGYAKPVPVRFGQLRQPKRDMVWVALAGPGVNFLQALLWWTVLLEPGRTFNLVVINALRAAGDARYPVLAGAASMVVVLAGGSWLLGVELGLGLVGVWIAYAADEWLRGLLMWRRWARLQWVPHARRSRRRLAAG